jgi:hypothetical protein
MDTQAASYIPFRRDVQVIHPEILPNLLGEGEISFEYDQNLLYLFDKNRFFSGVSKKLEANQKAFKPQQKGVVEIVTLDNEDYRLVFKELKPRYLYLPENGEISAAVFVQPVVRSVSTVMKKDATIRPTDSLAYLKDYAPVVSIDNLLSRAEAMVLGEIERLHANTKPVYIR